MAAQGKVAGSEEAVLAIPLWHTDTWREDKAPEFFTPLLATRTRARVTVKKCGYNNERPRVPVRCGAP